jgi:hypothetical protein
MNQFMVYSAATYIHPFTLGATTLHHKKSRGSQKGTREGHVNTEILQLLDNANLNRRPKRIKPLGLCSAQWQWKSTASGSVRAV